ncbi:MAG: 5'/3'-nucleotidase SurE [Chloroflexi bacterium]|nr:5'/3'-nucleotidase SurE [Chloroflexota bacterium]
MNILVTNDDGFDNSGIWALVNAVKDLGNVTVVAPAENQSGVGTAISFRRSVKINEAPSRVHGVKCYAVSGTPADSVILGTRHVLNDAVDAVVSGINPGFNTSRDMFISGTFGAAIIAAALGVKTCAFSMDALDDLGDQLVGKVIAGVTRELISFETPRAGLYNVNFPSFRDNPIRGAEAAAPADSELKMKLEAHSDGGYEVFSGLKMKIDRLPQVSGTDVEVLERGMVALTAVVGASLDYIPGDPSLKRMIDAANQIIG